MTQHRTDAKHTELVPDDGPPVTWGHACLPVLDMGEEAPKKGPDLRAMEADGPKMFTPHHGEW